MVRFSALVMGLMAATLPMSAIAGKHKHRNGEKEEEDPIGALVNFYYDEECTYPMWSEHYEAEVGGCNKIPADAKSIDIRDLLQGHAVLFYPEPARSGEPACAGGYTARFQSKKKSSGDDLRCHSVRPGDAYYQVVKAKGGKRLPKPGDPDAVYQSRVGGSRPSRQD